MCVMQSIAVVDKTDDTGAIVQVKFVFEDMGTCAAVKGTHLCEKYCDGPDEGGGGQGRDAVHRMPSMLRSAKAHYLDTLWFPYVIELSHVHTSVLEVSLALHDSVSLPYMYPFQDMGDQVVIIVCMA